MTEPDIEPIRMVGCDEEGVAKDPKKKGGYVIPFILSSKPPCRWVDLFDDCWRRERKQAGLAKVRAYAKKNDIFLECPLEQVATCFPVLRSAVTQANTGYIDIQKQKLEREEARKARRQEAESTERAAIHSVLENLDFS